MDPKKPKISRDIELRNLIMASEHVLRTKLAEAHKAADAIRYEALTLSTRACGANDKLRKAHMTGVLAARDARKRQAEIDYTAAIRKAEGDHKKRLNEIDADFDAGRAECEAEMVAKNAPIREKFAKDELAISVDLTNTIKDLDDKHTKYVLPLQTELDALEEVKRAKIEAAKEKTAAAVVTP